MSPRIHRLFIDLESRFQTARRFRSKLTRRSHAVFGVHFWRRRHICTLRQFNQACSLLTRERAVLSFCLEEKNPGIPRYSRRSDGVLPLWTLNATELTEEIAEGKDGLPRTQDPSLRPSAPSRHLASCLLRKSPRLGMPWAFPVAEIYFVGASSSMGMPIALATPSP
jgi:hypothetical protein